MAWEIIGALAGVIGVFLTIIVEQEKIKRFLKNEENLLVKVIYGFFIPLCFQEFVQ